MKSSPERLSTSVKIGVLLLLLAVPVGVVTSSQGNANGGPSHIVASTTSTTSTIKTTSTLSTSTSSSPTVSSSTTSTSSSTSATGVPILGLLDGRASYGISSYETPQVQQAALAMLESANSACVRVDIGYASWLLNKQLVISLIDNVVSSIRSASKCLVIADAASETYWNGGAIPWSNFTSAWVQRVETLASRYHPDYYIVVKEPGWYLPMISDVLTNPDVQNPSVWESLTRNLTYAVLSVSPYTTVGVSVGADSLNKNPSFYVPYINGCVQISRLSFIGFDIYSSTGQTATQTFLTQNGIGSKNAWVAEAWSGAGSQIFNSSREQSDAQWMSSIYQFSVQIHATMLIPFRTDLFANYTLPLQTDSNTIISLYNDRTPVFYAFLSLPRS